MAPKLFSRNAKLENESDRAMIVEVLRGPGTFLLLEFVIPSGGYKYMCYEDLRIEFNTERPVVMAVYLEGAREMGEMDIPPSEIRDNEKLKFNFLNGEFTKTLTGGHFISRLGIVIKLKHVAEQIRSRR